MSSVTADLTSVKSDIQEVKIIIGKNQENDAKKDKRQIEEIRSVIIQTMKVQTKTRPKGRQGG